MIEKQGYQKQGVKAVLIQAKTAFYGTSTLTADQKNRALAAFADLIEENTDFLLTENQKDIEAAKSDPALSSSLFQRLKLDKGKLVQLVTGIRDLITLPDPAGQVLSRLKLDEGLILEKQTVPLGVVAIIFESRPDVMPQILSLILKSGNAVVLKGGREAHHSNHAFIRLVHQLEQQCPWLPACWAQLLDSREAVQEMLGYPEWVDLVIPRGSNQLVQSIMAATKIPVLGHADGICHLYVHASADPDKAISVAIDAKAQYPAACNAIETLLVDEAIADRFLPLFYTKAVENGIQLKGCESARKILSNIEPATEEDWRTEYGEKTLSIRIISGLEAAIDHIHQYGSRHTDGILAQDPLVIEQFLNRVDSANVFANASTRFADGFRFGLGAEIGISTAKTHARGPVGLEGLVIYKYKLKGNGQIVADYVGEQARAFLHEPLQ